MKFTIIGGVTAVIGMVVAGALSIREVPSPAHIEINMPIRTPTPTQTPRPTPSPTRTPDAKLIGRLATGISEYKRSRNPFHCGARLDVSEISELSLKYAYHIVTEYSGSPWGMAATIANESRFDACAIGKAARDWATRRGILRSKRTSISHDRESVLSAVRAGYKHGIDLGPCQILTRFYPGQDAAQTTIAGGVAQCAKHMEGLGYKPWISWRGHRVKWYHDKIRRIAKRLGANKEEMREI